MLPVRYLDHNATSALRPEARAAMDHVLIAHGNPSSIHRAGRAARGALEAARTEVAGLVGARPEQVIFTSGGTEANALALWGAVQGAAAAGAPVGALYLSAIEHDSVFRTAAAIAQRNTGIRLVSVPVTQDGVVDLDALGELLNEVSRPALVAVMAANNETGVIQPVTDVIALVHGAGGFCLVDAVQARGRIAADFAVSGTDYLTLSAHKLGGPQGTGALVVRDGVPLAPQITGGSQERNRRAGTENVAGIAGFGAAAKACRQDDSSAALRDAFEFGLRQRFPDVIIFGESTPRLANTSNFAIPGIAAESAIIALDLDGVMVSSGAACSSGKVKPSHVLQAMGVPAELARSALRVSLGWNSTLTDVEAALASLEKLSARIRARMAA
ncbi:MAG TPA: cysteine desulfurase family protein [Rhizomicrobium sp.]|jgi:cysteine desulfurase|nr:cysteine desulfurase family protein [Rhizomicrobium sp.]